MGLRRGEIFLISLDPVIGSETGKTRPAIIVQNNLANKSSPTVTVIPLTSNIGRCYPFQVFLPASETGLSKDSKALCEQIRTVARERIVGERLGEVPGHLLLLVRSALERHLWFSG